MINSFCVALLVLINAFVHLTHADSYYESYDRNAGQRYPDSGASHVTNFGNGNNKHNIVKIEEKSDRTSISGASFTKDENGRPSLEKINVNVNNPDYRGGAQDPDVHYNPKSTRTQVTNIGNGVGNKNLFVFNDDRDDHPTRRNNQGGYQGRTRYITNIGKGPDNDNQVYVNNRRVYPSTVNNNGDQDPPRSRESVPSASDAQNVQNQGWDSKNNFNRQNAVNREYNTGYTPTNNGYNLNNYNVQNMNIGNGVNSFLPNSFDDPSLKVLPMLSDGDVQITKATERLSSVISDVSRYVNDFGNGHQNNNRIIINGKVIDPNAVSNNLNVPNKGRGFKAGSRTNYYKMRNPHFKRILRKNVRDMVRNPPTVQYRRRGWRRSLKNMLRRRYA